MSVRSYKKRFQIEKNTKFEEPSRVDKGVRPKVPQILPRLFDLKPCFVSMSTRLFYHSIYVAQNSAENIET